MSQNESFNKIYGKFAKEERSSAMYVESLVASQELSLCKEKTLMESYEGNYDIEKERLHSLIQHVNILLIILHILQHIY